MIGAATQDAINAPVHREILKAMGSPHLVYNRRRKDRQARGATGTGDEKAAPALGRRGGSFSDARTISRSS
jgi:hypothetical protein